MSNMDDNILKEFLEESLDHLDGIEDDLIQMESQGAEIDEELVNKVFRAVHSIKGGAGFLNLVKITRLCHVQESILNQVRKREMVPTADVTGVLLRTLDMVKRMLERPDEMDAVDIEEGIQALDGILSGNAGSPAGAASAKAISSSLAEPLEQQQSLLPTGVPDAEEYQGLRRRGFLCYRIQVPLDSLSGAAEAGQLRYNLENTGQLLESNPPLDQLLLLAGKPGQLDALYATVLDQEMMLDLIPYRGASIRLWEPQQQAISLPDVAPVHKELPPPAPPISAPMSAPPAEQPQAVVAVKASGSTDAAGDKIKVSLAVLDNLMAMAGELVLARNQLLQNIETRDYSMLEKSAQQVSFIVSELQNAIMSTRMQPVGNVFTKFKRIVRDLAQHLGKQIQLDISGEDVELDKTIIESIGDPLTHIVRNSCDHGIEDPDTRIQKGKPPMGTILLTARHEAGQVVIEVIDDGKGIDAQKVSRKAIEKGLVTADAVSRMSEKELINLVFHPGFSLADKVTDISGRGVGMDVVHTNFAKLGGTVDIQSRLGEGTTLQIKLPLTLAIIPGLMARVGEQVFAIPQVNLVELVRVAPDQVKKRIQKVGDAVLLRLREELLPLFSIREVLGIETLWVDPDTGEKRPDRRQRLADRRGPDETVTPEVMDMRSNSDRRSRMGGSVNIAVVSTGNARYGLVVDAFLDTEEVVVKPLGEHIKGLHAYAGATILGDGRPALILDIRGIAEKWLSSALLEERREEESDVTEFQEESHSMLIMAGGGAQYYAAPLGLISRIEMIPAGSIEKVSGHRHVQYRGGILPLFSVDEVAQVEPLAQANDYYAIIYRIGGKEVGLLVSDIVDTVDTSAHIDQSAYQQTGVLGTAIIEKRTTLVLDLFGIVIKIHPDWAPKAIAPPAEADGTATKVVLVVDDSAFFRSQVQKFVEETGYHTVVAADGKEAWDKLRSSKAPVGLVLTDIEMPVLDGLGLTKQIRQDPAFRELPVVAITSLMGAEAERRGLDAGVTEYMVKLDREKIIERVGHYMGGGES